jgi:transglutaminase-like putative cysteine protease
MSDTPGTNPERRDLLLPGQAAGITVLYALAYGAMVSHLATQVSLYFFLLICIRFLALRWPVLTPPRWLLVPLTLGALANVYHAYHTLAGQEGGTAFLASMLGLKLLEMRKVRDARVAAMLLCFLMVSRFLFDQSPWIAAYYTALLFADLALLVDLNNRVRPPVGRSARVALRLLLQAVPLTLVFFVLFPRLNAPLWNFQAADETGTTGIKPWLEPGAVSELVIDGSLAFRVRFDGPPPNPADLYWRGPVAWNTDGRRWLPGEPGQFPELKPGPASLANPLSYQVALEPSGHRWLFAIDIPTVTDVPGAVITHDYQVLASDRTEDNRVYGMTSALSYNTGELPLDEEAAATALPDNVTERMRTLVNGWKRQAGSHEGIVQTALNFFNREEFHYTLVPPKLGDNPADEFLFETRRGFCEHYASSFALLMRIAGIPSRVVMGYMGGERNPIGGHLIVRQSDAHAWTEVWLAGQGWVRVDPTAAVAPGRVVPTDLLAGLGAGAPFRFRLEDAGGLAQLVHGLRLLADAIDENWRHWVLELDRSRQLDMLDWAGLGHLREYGLAIAMTIGALSVLGLVALGLGRFEG